MNIHITSEETVKPSLPTPNHLRYTQLSLFDQLNSPFFIPTVYFFDRPRQTTSLETTLFLNKLKTALSTTLSIYYPLAGRLLLNLDCISCNDQGIPYLHAEIKSTRLLDVVRKAQISDLDPLTPSLDPNRFTDVLLAVQINVFTCGGIAIGIKSNHRVTDGFSILMFLNAWADISNSSIDPTDLPRPYFDTAKLFPPKCRSIDVVDESDPDLVMGKPVAKWFMFSREKLEELRSKLCSKYIGRNPSVFTVLPAFLWSRIIVATNNNNNNNTRKYEVFMPVNIRQRLSVPYENSFYFGNMIVNAIAKPSCNLNDDEASMCVDFMKNVQESVNKIRNDSDFIKDITEGKQDLGYVREQFDRESKGEITTLGFSNAPSLNVLEPDLGWGNPVWSTTGTMVHGLVIMTRAGPYSKDVVATINLNKEDMAKLEDDTVFNSLVFKKAVIHTCKSKL